MNFLVENWMLSNFIWGWKEKKNTSNCYAREKSKQHHYNLSITLFIALIVWCNSWDIPQAGHFFSLPNQGVSSSGNFPLPHCSYLSRIVAHEQLHHFSALLFSFLLLGFSPSHQATPPHIPIPHIKIRAPWTLWPFLRTLQSGSGNFRLIVRSLQGRSGRLSSVVTRWQRFRILSTC